MAESKRRWQDQCPLCRHGYVIAKLLDCKHSFCLPCLETVVGFWKEGEVEEPVTSIPCPRCRKEFAIPKKGLTALDDNEYIKGESGTGEVRLICCLNCDEDVYSRGVTVLCRDCKQMYCESCRKMHSRMTAAENHTVTEITQKLETTDETYDHIDSKGSTVAKLSTRMDATTISKSIEEKPPAGKTGLDLYLPMTRSKPNTDPEVNVVLLAQSKPGPSAPPSTSGKQEQESVSSFHPYANIAGQDAGEESDGSDCGGDTLLLNPRSRPPPLPPRPRDSSESSPYYGTNQYAAARPTQSATPYAIRPVHVYSTTPQNDPPYMTPTYEDTYDDIYVPNASKPMVHAQSMPCLTGTTHRAIQSPEPHYDVPEQRYDTRAVQGGTPRLQLKFKCSLREVQSICVNRGGVVVMVSKRIKKLGTASSKLQVFDANGQKKFGTPTDRHLISLAWLGNQEIILANMEDSKVYKKRLLSKELSEIPYLTLAQPVLSKAVPVYAIGSNREGAHEVKMIKDRNTPALLQIKLKSKRADAFDVSSNGVYFAVASRDRGPTVDVYTRRGNKGLGSHVSGFEGMGDGDGDVCFYSSPTYRREVLAVADRAGRCITFLDHTHGCVTLGKVTFDLLHPARLAKDELFRLWVVCHGTKETEVLLYT